MRSIDRLAYIIAVDIGGTFTDVTVQHAASARVMRAKTPSTPGDPSEAFLTGVTLALEAIGCGAGCAVGRVLHGTTVATNLILEGKGAPAALVTTAGFRHVLEIGRQDIPRAANLYAWIKPLAPRIATSHPGSDGAGRRWRSRADGVGRGKRGVWRPNAFARLGVAAVAVCLLHSFALSGA